MSNLGSLFGVSSGGDGEDYGGSSMDYNIQSSDGPGTARGGSDSEEEESFTFSKVKKSSPPSMFSPPSATSSTIPRTQRDSLQYVPPKEPKKNKEGILKKPKRSMASPSPQPDTSSSPAQAPQAQPGQPSIIFSAPVYLYRSTTKPTAFQPYPNNTPLGLVVLHQEQGGGEPTTTLLIYDGAKKPMVHCKFPEVKFMENNYVGFEDGGAEYSFVFQGGVGSSDVKDGDEIQTLVEQDLMYRFGLLTLRTKAFDDSKSFETIELKKSMEGRQLESEDAAGVVYALYIVPSSISQGAKCYDKSVKHCKTNVGSPDGPVGGFGKIVEGMRVGDVFMTRVAEGARRDGEGTRVNVEGRMEGGWVGVVGKVCKVKAGGKKKKEKKEKLEKQKEKAPGGKKEDVKERMARLSREGGAGLGPVMVEPGVVRRNNEDEALLSKGLEQNQDQGDEDDDDEEEGGEMGLVVVEGEGVRDEYGGKEEESKAASPPPQQQQQQQQRQHIQASMQPGYEAMIMQNLQVQQSTLMQIQQGVMDVGGKIDRMSMGAMGGIGGMGGGGMMGMGMMGMGGMNAMGGMNQMGAMGGMGYGGMGSPGGMMGGMGVGMGAGMGSPMGSPMGMNGGGQENPQQLMQGLSSMLQSGMLAKGQIQEAKLHLQEAQKKAEEFALKLKDTTERCEKLEAEKAKMIESSMARMESEAGEVERVRKLENELYEMKDELGRTESVAKEAKEKEKGWEEEKRRLLEDREGARKALEEAALKEEDLMIKLDEASVAYQNMKKAKEKIEEEVKGANEQGRKEELEKEVEEERAKGEKLKGKFEEGAKEIEELKKAMEALKNDKGELEKERGGWEKEKGEWEKEKAELEKKVEEAGKGGSGGEGEGGGGGEKEKTKEAMAGLFQEIGDAFGGDGEKNYTGKAVMKKMKGLLRRRLKELEA
ncbi:hypothetical protein TrCOL_g1458 [Triparma columacea]|uniref:Uncharacterized protein n=1 Tax=Triparma columacea TaxID=722753 RepID=A0A9W7GKZ9_9STRA|nr:hypothetical protein TrCOL_g1458 [Triparma columacea]